MAFPEENPEAQPEESRPEELKAEELKAEESQPETAQENAEHPENEQPQGEQQSEESLSADELLPEEPAAEAITMEDAKLKAVLEAIIYVTDEPLSLEQICIAIEQPRDRVIDALEQLAADYERPERGLAIREVAGGFKMTTKAEHHEAVRRFVKNLNPPLKLSLPALETLAVIAYKQPITAPEIMEIRGVQGAGVLKTLVERKLIGTAGRKQVVGKPILYRTTREFLVQFGLKDVSELPTLKEFQELARLDTEQPATLSESTRVESTPAESTPADSTPAEPTAVPEQDPPPAGPPVQEPPQEDPPAEEPPHSTD